MKLFAFTLFLALAAFIAVSAQQGPIQQGPTRLPNVSQQQAIVAARNAPSPMSVIVTYNVNGKIHTYTYTAAGAEVTKNRLIVTGKLTPAYTDDDFALAPLKMLDDQAYADALNPSYFTAAEAAKVKTTTDSITADATGDRGVVK
jgi:hypothetical protein